MTHPSSGTVTPQEKWWLAIEDIETDEASF